MNSENRFFMKWGRRVGGKYGNWSISLFYDLHCSQLHVTNMHFRQFWQFNFSLPRRWSTFTVSSSLKNWYSLPNVRMSECSGLNLWGNTVCSTISSWIIFTFGREKRSKIDCIEYALNHLYAHRFKAMT